MTVSADAASAVIEAFTRRGFRYDSRTPSGHFVLIGPLQTPAGPHECEVQLRSDFSAPPSVRLLQVPDELKPIAPHVDSEGGICYLSKSSVAINIFDPVGQMLACLNRAERVLAQLLRRELVADLAEEFFAYWGEDFCHCFFDIKENRSANLKCMVGTPANYRGAIFFITDDVKRTSVKSKVLGCDVHEVPWPVYRIYTKAVPRPQLDQWPPASLGDLLAWQALLEPRASRKISERIGQAAEKGNPAAIIMVESPNFLYAFVVRFKAFGGRTYSKTELRKKTVFNSSEVTALSGWRIDERYITQRNMPGMKTLVDKRIVLIGCGTIGGYLADMLVKAGAGAGEGELFLVDPDTLKASNVGRHRLGFSYVDQLKVKALMSELKACAPDANLRALPVDVRKANLGKIDLLIDATGEQVISDYLAVTYGKSTQLSIWIEGPGIAVRGLLRPDASGACFHCLTVYNRNGKYLSTQETLPQIYAGQGCEQEYVPFPATVSIHAACLACEMTLDWVAGNETPTLRTRVLDRAFNAATPDCVPKRLSECPACST